MAHSKVCFPAFNWKHKGHPQRKANILSKITFGWLNPLILLGLRRALVESDLFEMSSDLKVENATNRFEIYWAEEKIKPKYSFLLLFSLARPSLFRALRRSFATKFYFAGCLKLTHDCCQFVGPLILQVLLPWMILIRAETYCFCRRSFPANLRWHTVHSRFAYCHNCEIPCPGTVFLDWIYCWNEGSKELFHPPDWFPLRPEQHWSLQFTKSPSLLATKRRRVQLLEKLLTCNLSTQQGFKKSFLICISLGGLHFS